MEVTGGCLCKQVRCRITAAPIVTRICWRHQRERGAPGRPAIEGLFAGSLG
jgi:hypothetical protein